MTVNHALILCGGKSSRMKQDKASLCYYGEAQYKRVYTLVCNCFEHVFFSVAKHGVADYLLEYPHITDIQEEVCGPMGGIVSAFHAYMVSWFVVAIDMPHITQEAINYLMHTRAMYKEHTTAPLYATVPYTSDSYFEPLFALYEPDIQPHINEHYLKKQYSLQKLLKKETMYVAKVSIDSNILKNVNTYEEYQLYGV